MTGEILIGYGPDKLRIANSSPNEFTMRFLHIILIHHSVLERCIDALVAEKLLHLLNWHAFVDSHCSKRSSKLVWMHLMKTQLTTNFAEPDLHAADLKPVKWLQQGYKQCFIAVCAFAQIALQVDLCPGVKVDLALLISFTENDAFPIFKIHITAIELYELTDSDAG